MFWMSSQSCSTMFPLLLQAAILTKSCDDGLTKNCLRITPPKQTRKITTNANNNPSAAALIYILIHPFDLLFTQSSANALAPVTHMDDLHETHRETCQSQGSGRWASPPSLLPCTFSSLGYCEATSISYGCSFFHLHNGYLPHSGQSHCITSFFDGRTKLAHAVEPSGMLAAFPNAKANGQG
jgi:hypothetical protein